MMIAVVCIGDQNGMLLNRRRVSQDQAQQQDLLTFCQGRTLWMNGYSASLFPETSVRADPAFLQLAGPGEVCFVEDQPLLPVLDRIEQLVVYRWNRRYPATVKLDLDLGAFTQIDTREFPGNSHERITREIYERRV